MSLLALVLDVILVSTDVAVKNLFHNSSISQTINYESLSLRYIPGWFLRTEQKRLN